MGDIQQAKNQTSQMNALSLKMENGMQLYSDSTIRHPRDECALWRMN